MKLLLSLALLVGSVSSFAQDKPGCSGDFCLGSPVIDSKNFIGTVTQLPKDGKVEYLKRGYSVAETVLATTLSPKIEVLDSGIKAGVLVMDDFNHVGIVLNVFKNKKVEYQKEGSSSSDITQKVHSEVDLSSAGYSKATVYATEDGAVGTPVHFFDNGQTQLLTETGTKVVGKDLAVEVASQDDLVKGELILLPTLKSYPVERVFQNRTVVLTTPMDTFLPGGQMKKISLVVPALNDTLEATAMDWIRVIRNLDKTSVSSSLWIKHKGIKKVMYIALRAAIFDALDDSDARLTQKERDRVEAYLPEKLAE